jgi:ketose-bisphosphate aldolase
MIKNAQGGGYALGYFESWNLESTQAVVDAAEQTRSPVIIGFNGGFLSHSIRVVEERLELYAALGRAAAESSSVPCGLIFNECAQDDWIKKACQLGFNLVMPVDPEDDYDSYLKRAREVVKYAHRYGAAVEVELGKLPSGLPNEAGQQGSFTDPQKAAHFVRESGVDLLAVSVGNIHAKLKGEQYLDFTRLAILREEIPVPLVLHGGTGIKAEALKKAVSMGVVKVNFGTYIKQRYLAEVRRALSRDYQDLYRLLGYGTHEDITVIGRRAVREAVRVRIDLLGCCGKV